MIDDDFFFFDAIFFSPHFDEQSSNTRQLILNNSCITKWLHNFKAVCPLCNWNADCLFGDARSERTTPGSSLGSRYSTRE